MVEAVPVGSRRVVKRAFSTIKKPNPISFSFVIDRDLDVSENMFDYGSAVKHMMR